MKRIYILIVLCVAAFGLKAQSPEQESIKAKNIYVSFDFVKHLVFPVQVSDIEVGEKELISAERVEEAPHVVRLCAQSEDFEKETNVTVVCIDGSVYTYHVKYIANGLIDPSLTSMKITVNGNTTIIRRMSVTCTWPSFLPLRHYIRHTR